MSESLQRASWVLAAMSYNIEEEIIRTELQYTCENALR